MLKVLRSTLERVSSIGIWNNSQHAARISSKIEPNLEAEIDLPKKPKKPMISWLVFLRERRNEILRQNSNLKLADVVSMLAKEWKNIDKSKYEEEYNRRRVEYLKQCEDYERSLTDQQRDYLSMKKELDRDAKAHRKLQKLKPPKMPRNPGNLYCAEKFKQPDIQEQLKYRRLAVISKELFDEYRSLSDQERSKYIEMQRQDVVRFEREFNEWYEGVMNNSEVNKAVKAIASNMRDRFKTLKYIS